MFVSPPSKTTHTGLTSFTFSHLLKALEEKNSKQGNVSMRLTGTRRILVQIIPAVHGIIVSGM